MTGGERLGHGLVLWRKGGQKVILQIPDGREITVTIEKGTSRSGVKLVFDGPEDVLIFREELIQEET